MVATSRQVDEVPSPRLVGNRSSLRAGNQLRALRLQPSSSFFHLASLFPSSFLPRPPPFHPLSLSFFPFSYPPGFSCPRSSRFTLPSTGRKLSSENGTFQIIGRFNVRVITSKQQQLSPLPSSDFLPFVYCPIRPSSILKKQYLLHCFHFTFFLFLHFFLYFFSTNSFFVLPLTRGNSLCRSEISSDLHLPYLPFFRGSAGKLHISLETGARKRVTWHGNASSFVFIQRVALGYVKLQFGSHG